MELGMEDKHSLKPPKFPKSRFYLGFPGSAAERAIPRRSNTPWKIPKIQILLDQQLRFKEPPQWNWVWRTNIPRNHQNSQNPTFIWDSLHQQLIETREYSKILQPRIPAGFNPPNQEGKLPESRNSHCFSSRKNLSKELGRTENRESARTKSHCSAESFFPGIFFFGGGLGVEKKVLERGRRKLRTPHGRCGRNP